MKEQHTRKYLQKNQKNFRKGNKTKKNITDYQFYIGTNKQAAKYKITSEFIINFIKRTFHRGNDISETLRTLKLQDTTLWMPKLKISSSENEDQKKTENRQNEIEYKALLDEAIKRKDKYEQNLYKVYAVLWEKCSRRMQNKITGRNDFKEKIFNNPIILLLVNKKHSLNYQESRYEMNIITDAIRAFLNTKQKESETLQDYTRRFKTSKEIMESHVGGPLVLQKYIQITEEYKNNMKRYKINIGNVQDTIIEPNVYHEKYAKKAASKLYAYIYLENGDKTKYDSILKNLNQQNSFGNNQCPKSIAEANSILNKHKFDITYLKSQNSQRGQTNKNENNISDTEDALLSLTFTQTEGRCYCCGKSGHKSPQCTFKYKPKSEWFINKLQFTQKNQENKEKNENTTEDTEEI